MSKMYHALFYKTVENYVERRAPYRAAHLELATSARENGQLILAGAYDEPADGALLVFKGTREVAENFAKNDPYVINGLITEWTVRKWNVVIGND